MGLHEPIHFKGGKAVAREKTEEEIAEAVANTGKAKAPSKGKGGQEV